MKLIVGLGNPGIEYERTRHNAGFLIVDEIVEDMGFDWSISKKTDSVIAKGINKKGESVIFAKPTTFMNHSGGAVSKLVKYYDISPRSIYVVHDDVDLPFGDVRYKSGMGPGGHNGVDDVVQALGTKNFWRFRVGVGRPDINKFDVRDYVLSNFSDSEIAKVKELAKDFEELLFRH